MYRRYNYNTNSGQSRNSGGSENQEMPKPIWSEPAHRHENNVGHTNNRTEHKEKKGLFGMLAADGGKGIINTIFNFIPSEIYNRDNKRILGLLTAEDLLLFALILLVADSDDNDNIPLLVALIYILFA